MAAEDVTALSAEGAGNALLVLCGSEHASEEGIAAVLATQPAAARQTTSARGVMSAARFSRPCPRGLRSAALRNARSGRRFTCSV